MSISPKLMMRQSQSLVMTPQLLQAIKLLQFSTVELQDYVEAELEKNPLLERDARSDEAPLMPDDRPDPNPAAIEPGDWAREDLPADRATLERETGTDFENAFPDEAVADQALPQPDSPFWNLSGGSGRGPSLDDDDPNLEAYCAAASTLHEHLENQLGCTDTDDLTRMIAAQIIDQIDQTGYLLESLPDMAQRLGVPESRCALALEIVQGSIRLALVPGISPNACASSCARRTGSTRRWLALSIISTCWRSASSASCAGSAASTRKIWRT